MKNNIFDGIETVLLDLDGTVLDFLKGQHTALKSACESNGVIFTEELYEDFSATNIKYWKLFEKGEITKESLVYERFYDLFGRRNIKADVVIFEGVYQANLGEQHFFIDGALDGVKYLNKKYKIFVASNGVARTQLNRLKKSGLSQYVDKVFISEDIGYPKPQKEYFDVALKDVDRDKTVIIGDSMTSDIKGGINAKIKTLWFNPGMDKKLYEPSAEARSWEEIKSLL